MRLAEGLHHDIAVAEIGVEPILPRGNRILSPKEGSTISDSCSSVVRHGASGNVSERLTPDTVSDSTEVRALAAELLHDAADQKPIEVRRLARLAWAVLTRDEIGRLARAVLDAPREHALRRAVELTAAVLASSTEGTITAADAVSEPGSPS